ncbi:hypothetical protein JRO89_XS07G0291900 [Xanthoceras sorbifolium]|uniref:RNase H type-1 domain-containing protein n=1 Tax=Xanthoceras sorbifolium TaxID=99658 RepID=A0ABQ8HVK5_9ROSI|nr:hypothetical protein JRO89_XS07G0291900 [Xanthoceras sorbifolium]
MAWNDRNFQLHGGGKIGRNFWARAEAFLSKFEAANCCPKLPQSAGSFAVDIVIRDSEGLLVQATAKCFLWAVQVELAEAIAVLEGIQLVLRSGFSLAIVASNALGVVELCNGFSVSRCGVANIVLDIQLLLSQNSFISVVFSPKNSNRAAHGVARWALDASFSSCWSVAFPNWLCKLVLEDVSDSFVG